jgi:hypothetical protein
VGRIGLEGYHRPATLELESKAIWVPMSFNVDLQSCKDGACHDSRDYCSALGTSDHGFSEN